VIDALVALAGDAKKDLRARAYRALTALRTRESVAAAGAAILLEKDDAARRTTASLLFAVQGIFGRADTAQTVKAGIADRDAGVRVAFAMLSPPDMEAANVVLRTDGIKHPDHHVRESAAMELGKRGDAAGETILAGMLARTSLPGAEKGEPIYERLLIEEQVAVCRILGKLGTVKGRAALAKAAKSKHEVVRKAAEAALAE
jgi:HEAT repeat protein